ncbi:ethylbenzene dehydrogenase-related protein [Halosimplex aquaticum]|uniref:Ethylbenzene dehydrogenase-related protein n=1 Tax=Halosimplex aquaticum TaxID=3026162 RepID=A0ABD5XZZ7_9EURY|nr:ethylbenzene dehydrogenase-related protein [Halosimplex aquaticum]
MPSEDRDGGALSRVAKRLPLDRGAAVRATTLAVVTVALLLAGQAAVGAAVTGGSQPVASVQSVPTEPTASAWNDAPTRTVSLSKQQMAPPFGGGSVDELDVQTAANESHVSVRLSWEDPTRNADIAEPRNFSDAAAVMLKTGEQPPITMGAAGTPVNVWYWRASWRHGPQQSDGAGDMYAYPHNDSVTMPGRQAGNPLSRASFENGAQNYYAKGYGSLSYAPEQPVEASGERTEDGWRVTFVRNRTGVGQYDASITDQKVYLAFAVWNGSADEANGQKSLTLQFSTLDPSSGNLSVPDSGGGAGSGSVLQVGGNGTGGGSGRDGRPLAIPGFVGGVVLSALLVWLVTYWRVA